MKKIMLIMVLLILMITIVSAEEFSTELEITVGNGKVIVDYEGGEVTYNYDVNNTHEYDLNIAIERDVETIINYSRISDSCNNLNSTHFIQQCDIIMENRLQGQREYFAKTFMPSVEELETCKGQVSGYEIKMIALGDTIEDQQRALSFMNSTQRDYIKSLEKQTAVSYWFLSVIALLIAGGGGYLIVTKAKEKQGRSY